MNANKICFISCVNDDNFYQKCLSHIYALEIPEGFSIETLAIKNAASMASGYNTAMQQTDAKYKIYLHQDVFIINKSIIQDILKIFENSEIGMIGVAGSAQFSATGVWWESKANYGKVYSTHTGPMNLLSFQEVTGEYQAVQGIDGLIMITQYDIFWREDLFTGWHFYDVAQSMEFRRNGYKVVVPKQQEPWCMHDSGVKRLGQEYNDFRLVFIDEYTNDLFPLVSILIPAYNQTEYLEKALLSALHQDYPNFEIVVCDDSTTADVRLLLEQYAANHSCIRYFNNGGPLGGRGTANLQKCFDMCRGQYISFLLHDDLYFPNKISTMMPYLNHDSNVKLVTSYRKLIDSAGNVLPDIRVTQPFYVQTTRVTGSIMGNFILTAMSNVIGEMSTTMFRKADVSGKVLDFYGYQLSCLGDVGLWLKLLAKGDLVYIREPLSCFRIHTGQNSYTKALILLGAIEWFKLITLSYREKLYLSEEEYISAIREWGRRHGWLVTDSTVSVEEKNLQAELTNLYKEASEIIRGK